jgi:hypothetical protein
MLWRHVPPASVDPASSSHESAALLQPLMRFKASVAVAVGSSVLALVRGALLQP